MSIKNRASSLAILWLGLSLVYGGNMGTMASVSPYYRPVSSLFGDMAKKQALIRF